MRGMLAVVLVLAAGPARADVVAVGERMPELDAAVDRAGKPAKLAAYRGRWVVVTVGASWCGPCKAELPVWDRVAGQVGRRFTFVALDLDDDVDDGKAFHDALKLAHVVRLYLPQERSAITGRLGDDRLPTTFVIDPGGVVRFAHAGFDSHDPTGEARRLVAKLDALVPPPPPKPKPKPTPKDPPPKSKRPARGPVPPVAAWPLGWRVLVR